MSIAELLIEMRAAKKEYEAALQVYFNTPTGNSASILYPEMELKYSQAHTAVSRTGNRLNTLRTQLSEAMLLQSPEDLEALDAYYQRGA